MARVVKRDQGGKREPGTTRAVRPVARSAESGFAMLLVFVMAASVSLMLYKEMPRLIFESQRIREQELIEHGEQYKRAIQLYVRKYKKYPASLDDLETGGELRFLRRRYKDPMTGKDEWRLVHIDNAGFYTDSLIHKPQQQQEEKKSQNTFITEGAAFGSTGPAPGEEPTTGAAVRGASDRPVVQACQFRGASPIPGQPGYPAAPTTGEAVQGAPDAEAGSVPPEQGALPFPFLNPGQGDPGQQTAGGVQYPGAPAVPGYSYPQPVQPGYPAVTPGQQPPYGVPGQYPYPQPGAQPGGQPVQVPYPVGIPGLPSAYVPGATPGAAGPYPAYPTTPGATTAYPGYPGYTGQNPAYPGAVNPYGPPGQLAGNPAQAQNPYYSAPGAAYPYQPAGPTQSPQYGQQPFPNPQQTNPSYPQYGQQPTAGQGFPTGGAQYVGPAQFPGVPQSPAGPVAAGGAGGFAGSGGSASSMPGGGGQPGVGAFGSPGAAAANPALQLIGDMLKSPRPGGLAGLPGSGMAGVTGIGGGIAGVASTLEAPSIMVYNERSRYNEWEFLYDQREEQAAAAAAQARGAGIGGEQNPLGGGPNMPGRPGTPLGGGSGFGGGSSFGGGSGFGGSSGFGGGLGSGSRFGGNPAPPPPSGRR